MFTLRRPWLKDGVVHADVFALRIELAEARRELSRAICGGDLFEQTGGLREMFAQRIRQGARAPQKHAAIPKIISSRNEVSSVRRIRLFRKPANSQRSTLWRTAHFDVTVASFGSSGLDADDDDVFTGGRNLNALLQSFAKALFIRDHVVGRKQPNDGIGIFPQQKKGCQADGWRRISSSRLSQHLSFR